MTDELRSRMAAEAGAGEPPPVADLWRAGRRRRSTRRAGAALGAVAAFLLVGGVVARVADTDDAQTVRAGAVAETCEPRRISQSEGPLSVADPAVSPPEAPRTPAAMVHGGGTEFLAIPDAVVRVKVLSTDAMVRRDPLGMNSDPDPDPERRAWVEVVDPVFGAEAGDRFTISDAGTVRERAELKALKEIVTQQISDFQRDVDEIDAPVAALDEQISRLDPNDPRYQGLLDQRVELKDQTDAARTEAQNQLSQYQQRLQIIQLTERLLPSMPAGTSCYRFHEGDELVVALVRPDGEGPFELTGSSSFFLIDGDGFSEELDAARLSVPGWSDSELLRLARESTPDQFLDRLRQAADD